jgi:hypothetical protein
LTHKFDFRADLRKVYERLAGKEQDDAGMAEMTMHHPRNVDDSGLIPDASTTSDEAG